MMSLPQAAHTNTQGLLMYRVVQKTDTQFYFWDSFGNSARDHSTFGGRLSMGGP